jgi:rRNA maturation endonuclease Nob1
VNTTSDARTAVIRQLAEAYDCHAEREQVMVFEGDYEPAQVLHEVAIRVLRAYRAEMDDPQPEGL